ncbi:hypothetical protein Golomagni_05012 [Golovinomyces magnicellulatus]|nr:hypothetical protein Golomagni_05012 [Golovinomyces magnicellulatus]
MKSSTFATLIFFGSVISSPHRHLHHHVARNPNQQEEGPVIWETEVVVKTVQVTATVWVTPLAEPTHASVERPAAEEVVSTPNIPAQFFEPQPSMDIDSPSSEITSENKDDTNHFPEPQPSSVTNTPSPEIASEKIDHPNNELINKDRPSETVTQSQEDSGENREVTEPWSDEIKSPEPSMPSEPSTPSEPSMPSEPSTPSEPVTASSQPPSEASLGSNTTAIHDHATAATCSSSSPCNGDITYYDPGVGYGACGWKNTKNEPVVALPHEFMGSRSNGNSYCGKTITIVRDGKKSTARVVDKCMGCTGFSIDLSDAVFSQLAALSVGRTNAKWWVN